MVRFSSSGMYSIFTRGCILLLFHRCFKFSFSKWFVVGLDFVFYSQSRHSYFLIILGVYELFLIVFCKGFQYLVRHRYHSCSSLQWWHWSRFIISTYFYVVGVIMLNEFTYLCHMSFLSFLKTLLFIALLILFLCMDLSGAFIFCSYYFFLFLAFFVPPWHWWSPSNSFCDSWCFLLLVFYYEAICLFYWFLILYFCFYCTFCLESGPACSFHAPSLLVLVGYFPFKF